MRKKLKGYYWPYRSAFIPVTRMSDVPTYYDETSMLWYGPVRSDGLAHRVPTAYLCYEWASRLFNRNGLRISSAYRYGARASLLVECNITARSKANKTLISAFPRMIYVSSNAQRSKHERVILTGSLYEHMYEAFGQYVLKNYVFDLIPTGAIYDGRGTQEPDVRAAS